VVPSQDGKTELEGRKELPGEHLGKKDDSEGAAKEGKAGEPRGQGSEGDDFEPETAEREALLVKYSELEKRCKESEDRMLRVAADAENFKKRLEREREEQTRYANEVLIRELLPVMDNLERALNHSQASPNQEGLMEGLKMTLKGFRDALSRLGCNSVEAVGEPFDPRFHEAVSQVESTEHPPNTVVQELQKGYVLKDRLLRPAMVVVACSPPRVQAGNSEGEGTAERAEESGSSKVRIKVNPA
jgi:molecular chaperone GrpE